MDIPMSQVMGRFNGARHVGPIDYQCVDRYDCRTLAAWRVLILQAAGF